MIVVVEYDILFVLFDIDCFFGVYCMMLFVDFDLVWFVDVDCFEFVLC